MSRKLPNASEMGKLGGKKLVEKYGSKYMAEIGARGRETIKKRDPDFYKRLAESGLKARADKKAKARKSPAEKLSDLLTGKQ